MSETSQQLPVLTLDDLVVLPRMAVTIPLQNAHALAAARSAADGGRLVLIPRVDGRYSSIGTIAKLEEIGKTPDGRDVAVVAGRIRGRIGAVTEDSGSGALVADVEPLPDPTAWTDRSRELASEYRALVENILDIRGASQIAQVLRSIDNPGHLADMSGYSPDWSQARKVEILETVDVEERLQKLIAWYRVLLGELSLKEELRTEVQDKMEKQQGDFYPPPADGRDQKAAGGGQL